MSYAAAKSSELRRDARSILSDGNVYSALISKDGAPPRSGAGPPLREIKCSPTLPLASVTREHKNARWGENHEPAAGKIRRTGWALGAAAVLPLASQLLPAGLSRRHVRRRRLRPVRRRAAADRQGVRPGAGAGGIARHRRAGRRVSGRAVLGHDLRLHR